jgi:hypothetical protein
MIRSTRISANNLLVRPAHAGMIRLEHGSTQKDQRSPCTRGDDPEGVIVEDESGTASVVLED